MVATDVLSRGIDIDTIDVVVNYDVPHDGEDYVHRIGRTGRAGADGTAFSFCYGEEKVFLRDIEKLIGNKIPVVKDHPFPLTGTETEPAPKKPQQHHRQASGGYADKQRNNYGKPANVKR